MSTDPIPSSDNDFANLLQNFGTRLAPLAVGVGLTAAEATALSTDAAGLRSLVLDQQDKQNAAKSATAAKSTARAAMEKRARLLIRRIKAHSSYTPALGEQLGIVGASGATASTLAITNLASLDDKPALKVSVTGDGTVMVKFAKSGHTGVLLYSRRSGEAEFTLLAKQFRSPLIDTRENLSPGAPETREYMAQFFEGDEAVGQFSDRAAATIPGATTQAVFPAPKPQSTVQGA